MYTGIFLLIVGLVIFAIFVLMHNEEKIVEKAESKSHMAAFYHVLAKLCSGNYKGYNSTDSENDAMKEFLTRKTVYDTHPIGSYFKMRKELGEILDIGGNFHNYSMGFNLGEVGTGVMVMLVFAIVVMLGVIYC